MPFDPDALIAANNAAPALDPQMAVGIAQTAPDVPTAVQNSQATAGFGKYTTWANTLREQSGGEQRQAWKGINPTDQQALNAAGYRPPKASKSIFGQIVGGVEEGTFGAAGVVAHGVAGVGGTVGHAATDVLNAAGAPLRLVQHVNRAQRLVGQSGMTPGQQVSSEQRSGISFGSLGEAANSWSKVLSPSAWAQAWNQSEHGERTYEPGLLRQVQSSTDPATFALAKAMADVNGDPNKLQTYVQNLPPASQQQAVDRLQNDTAVRQTANKLIASKLSPGRILVGEQFQLNHPAAAKVISGVADAAVDWYGDPANQIVGGLKEANDARFVLGGTNWAENVDRVSNYRSAQRALGEIDTFARNGDYAGMVRRFPSLERVAQPLADAGVDSKEAFVDWMKGSAGMQAWLAGDGGAIAKAGSMFPRATALSDAANAAKQSMTGVVDTMGGPLAGITKLIPHALDFNPNSNEAPQIVRQVAELALPRQQADMLMNDYYAATDIAGRRNVYKSLLNTVADQTGVLDSPEGQRYWSRFMSTLDENDASRIYSTTADDKLPLGGKPVPTGILAGQTFGRWGVPDARMLLAAKNKITLPGRAYEAVVNGDGVSAFMQSAWKPLQLLRLGFSPRVAGEELFGALVRDGAPGLVRARLAASSVKGLEAGAEDRILPWHPLAHVWGALTDHLDDGSLRSITDAADKPREVFAQILGDRARSAFRHVEGALAGDEYVQAARDWYDRYGPRFLNDEVSALHTNGLDRFQTPETVASHTKSGVKIKPAYLAPGEGFRGYAQTDPLYLQMFKKNLDEIANDPLGATAIDAIDQGREAQVGSVKSVLEADTGLGRQLRAQSSRATVLPDGRMVGVDATQDEALTDWAGKVVDHVNGLLTDAEGNRIGDLAEYLNEHSRAPSVAELGALPTTRLPAAVKGPEMVPAGGNSAYRNFLDKGFTEMVGRPMDWMARQPITLHNYVLAKRETAGLEEALAAQFPRYTTQVVDDAGEPLRVYHGTNQEFQRFKLSPSRYTDEPDSRALYFTDDPATASTHATMATGGSPNVHVGYLDMRDPMTVSGPLGDRASAYATAQAAGHDGIIWKRPNGATEYVIFDPKKFVADPSRLLTPGGNNVRRLATDIAMEKAVRRTVPFIHNPELKSQFAAHVQNLMPFEFAQEQFYKRWARTFAYAPESFRKAQLIHQGIQHSGFIHTDANGNEYFNYPLAGQFQQDVLVPALKALGINAPTMPIMPGFSGDVKMATPGLERIGAPSFGPLVSVPLKELAKHFPELVGAQQAALGAGANTPVWEDIVPGDLSRIYQVVATNDENSPMYASALHQAIQYLEASGHGLPDNADQNSPAYQKWIDQVRNWTRITVLTRSLLGFSGPATPTIKIDYHNINQRLGQLMNTLPANEAYAQLVKEFPNATPYTITGTATPGKASMPATQQTLDFINANQGFLKDYPLAGGWLIPQTAGKFDSTAYTTELDTGLRQRKDTTTFVNDVKYGEAAKTYFPSLDAYDAAKANLHGQQLTALDKAWTAWQTSFFQAHPTFSDMLNSGSAKLDRGQIVDQLSHALDDPRAPQTPLTTPAKTLVGSLVAFQQAKTQLTNSTQPGASQRLARLEDAFATWGQNFASYYPDLQPLYDRIVRPEIGGKVAAAQTLAVNLAADQLTGAA